MEKDMNKENKERNKEKKEVNKEEKKVNKQSENIDIDKLKEELKKELLKELQEEKENKEIKEEVKEETKDKVNKEEKINGEETINNGENNKTKSFEDKAKETVEKIMDTKDDTNDYETNDIENNKGMAIISYLGPLCIIPFLVTKESKYAKYHAKQGLNLFIIELAFSIVSYFLKSLVQIPKMCSFLGEFQMECGSSTPWWLSLPLSLVELILAVISLIGIVYACQGKAKELPLVGKIKVIK